MLCVCLSFQTGILLSKPSDDKPMGSQVNLLALMLMLTNWPFKHIHTIDYITESSVAFQEALILNVLTNECV